MDNIQFTYKSLLERTSDLVVLQSAVDIIHWDMETMMPPKAVEQRSQQLALLSRISHKMSTAPEIGKLLNATLTNPHYDALGEVEKRNIYLIKKNYEEQTALPEKLVAEIAKQQAITVNTWKKAKNTKNFAVFKPELEKLVTLSKQTAQILMQVKKTATPYDALLDIYESKITSDAIKTTFNQLQRGLATLLEKIQSTHNQPDTNILHIPVPVEKQRKIAQALTQALGYDTTSPTAGGRIDETEHPFTSGYYDDVRITTHYHRIIRAKHKPKLEIPTRWFIMLLRIPRVPITPIRKHHRALQRILDMHATQTETNRYACTRRSRLKPFRPRYKQG
jgi:carboxypeptidase Taq